MQNAGIQIRAPNRPTIHLEKFFGGRNNFHVKPVEFRDVSNGLCRNIDDAAPNPSST